MLSSFLAAALLFTWMVTIPGAAARPPESSPPAGAEDGAAATSEETSLCELIERSAAENGLPVEYFTRLIWRESSFRTHVVSPVGAQGIAQFMPGTAAERGLGDPFDPFQAIPASAQLLKSLADRFGNLGLAAAAYNSGPRRVTDWLSGAGGLPLETRNYVAAITGRMVEDWRPGTVTPPRDEADAREKSGPASCLDVLAALDAPPLTPVALQSPTEGADWEPWGVQVAGNFSESKALSSYRNLQALYPTLLADRDPLIVRQRNLSLGPRPMVHVRLPAPTRQAANDLCRQLRDAGAACVVLKN